MKKLFFVVSMIFISKFSFSQKNMDGINFENLDTTFLRNLIIEKINELRIEKKLSPYVFDSTTYKAAEYQAAYVTESSVAKSEYDMRYSFYNESPFRGQLLIRPQDRLEFFSTSDNTFRRFLESGYVFGFHDEIRPESYEAFAVTTISALLEGGAHSILFSNTTSENFIGIGIAFKKHKNDSYNSYEFYIDFEITKNSL